MQFPKKKKKKPKEKLKNILEQSKIIESIDDAKIVS